MPDFATFAPVTDRDIERYLTDELDADARAAFEVELQRQPALQAHIDDRRASQAAFAQLHPPPAFLDDTPPRPFWQRWWWTMPAFAMAALLVVGLPSSTTGGDGIVARGSATFAATVTVKRGDRLFALPSTAPSEGRPQVLLRKGDALRVDIEGGVGHTLLLALQSGGRGTVLLQSDVDQPKWSQPSSLVLDDAVGEERLVAVLCDAADVGVRRRALEAGQVPQGAMTWRYSKEPQ